MFSLTPVFSFLWFPMFWLPILPSFFDNKPTEESIYFWLSAAFWAPVCYAQSAAIIASVQNRWLRGLSFFPAALLNYVALLAVVGTGRM